MTSSRPPGASERSESVKRSPPDGVDHDVDAASAGEPGDGIPETVGEHDLVGTGSPGDLGLVRATRRPR